MKHIRLSILIVCIAIVALSGCALYPAVQVAGGAMTGYDAVVIADDYLPRESVAGGERCADQDRMLERRMRERMRMNNLPVSAHVIDGNAYLVGQLPSRSQADAAVETAQSVQGIKTITCKFFPASTMREANNDARLLKKLAARLGATKRLDNADLRIEVIRSNAILIGEASTYDQKTAAVAIAHEVGGIADVIDYITVMPPMQSDEVASL